MILLKDLIMENWSSSCRVVTYISLDSMNSTLKNLPPSSLKTVFSSAYLYQYVHSNRTHGKCNNLLFKKILSHAGCLQESTSGILF